MIDSENHLINVIIVVQLQILYHFFQHIIIRFDYFFMCEVNMKRPRRRRVVYVAVNLFDLVLILDEHFALFIKLFKEGDMFASQVSK